MANRFWVGGTATWDSTTTANWSTTSGGAGGASVPGPADVAVFDGGSGAAVVTVAATINGTNTLSGITFTGTGGFAGTLDFSVNNPTITLGTVSFTGSGTRTVSLGSAALTVTGTIGTVWDMTNVTGLTWTANTATIVLGGSPVGARNFTIASTITIYSLTVNTPAGAYKTGAVNLNGGGTYTTLTTNSLTNISFAAATTVTNLNITGSSGGLALLGVNTSTVSTVTVTTASITWAVLANTTFAGSAVSATNSYNAGQMTLNGGSISNPSSSGGGVFGS